MIKLFKGPASWVLKITAFGRYASCFRVPCPRWYVAFPWTTLCLTPGRPFRYGKFRLCAGRFRIHSARVGQEF